MLDMRMIRFLWMMRHLYPTEQQLLSSLELRLGHLKPLVERIPRTSTFELGNQDFQTILTEPFNVEIMNSASVRQHRHVWRSNQDCLRYKNKLDETGR